MEIRTGILLDGEIELRAVGDVDEGTFDADKVLSRCIEAYALTWGTPVRGEDVHGEPCWVQYRSDAFAQWLESTDFDESPPLVKFDHGWTKPYDGEVGQLVYVAHDGRGLRTISVLDEARGGDGPLERIRLGLISAYSAHVEVNATRRIGTHEGLPLYEVTRGRLVECGPTTDPSDPGAAIIRVGGEEPTDVDDLRAILDLGDDERNEREVAAIHAERSLALREAIRHRQSLAGAVAYHRRAAWSAYEDFRAIGRGGFMTAALESRRLAEEADEELRDACCHDNRLRQDFLAAASAPEALTLAHLTGRRG